MPDLPTGTITFLFTDLEGSTRQWDEHPAAIEALRKAIDLPVQVRDYALGDHAPEGRE